MHYFVTGATGFIGMRLVKKLLERKGSTVYFLLREESVGKVAALRDYWGVSAARAVAVHGDLTTKKLGVSADEESQIAVNIDGTRNTVEFAKAIGAGHFTMCRQLRRRVCTRACSAKTCLNRLKTTSTLATRPSTRWANSTGRFTSLN